MADPFAPPTEHPTDRTRGTRPVTTYEAAPPLVERDTHRSRRVWEDRDTRDEPRPEPARPGVFWVVAGIGIALLLLARLILYFSVADDLPDGTEASALFAVFGLVALSAGLTLAGILQRGLATPWRIALLLGAGFFAVAGDGFAPFAGFGGLF